MNVKMKRTAALSAAAVGLCLTFAACAPEPYVDERTQVTLNYNDSVSRPRAYFLEEGESLQTPEEPLREGYTIEGWYTAPENGTKVEFPYSPTENTTLYAQWVAAKYNVTFNFNFAGSTPYVVQADFNTDVSAPESSVIPNNPGNRFYRWETANGEEAVFPYRVRRDAEFLAAWISNDTRVFNVTFNGNFTGAPEYRSLEIVEGRQVRANQRPNITADTRPGYTFMGWATSPNATAEDVVQFPYTPTGDTDFYAVWEVRTYIVRFRRNDYAGGNNENDVISDSREQAFAQVNAPANPVREGFEFIGWYDNAVTGNRITFPLNVEDDVVAYAHWRSNPVNTNTFDAEFTTISPDLYFPAYSGGNSGVESLLKAAATGATSEQYPILGGKETEHVGHYVDELCATGGTITFNINSTAAVSNATLYITVAAKTTAYAISSSNENAYKIYVNDVEISYAPINLQVGTFVEHQVSANVSLRQGENIIRLVADNHNVNGTQTARCPMLDKIRFGTVGGAQLSWSPEYDNLYRAK